MKFQGSASSEVSRLCDSPAPALIPLFAGAGVADRDWGTGRRSARDSDKLWNFQQGAHAHFEALVGQAEAMRQEAVTAEAVVQTQKFRILRRRALQQSARAQLWTNGLAAIVRSRQRGPHSHRHTCALAPTLPPLRNHARAHASGSPALFVRIAQCRIRDGRRSWRPLDVRIVAWQGSTWV